MKRLLLVLIFIPFLSYAQNGKGGEGKTPLFNDSTQYNTKVLYIVDGIPYTFEKVSQLKLNEEDIKDISILKEASAKLISCNPLDGIIIITTKSAEYEITVLDAGYYFFLATQPSPDFYTETWLKSKNMNMVSEWNYRHRNPLRYNSDIYEVSIDYNHNIDYGLEFEYKLYMFFKFMMAENNMSLI